MFINIPRSYYCFVLYVEILFDDQTWHEHLVHKPFLVRQCKRRRRKTKLCMLINSAIVSIVTSLRSNPLLSFVFLFISFTKKKNKSVQMHIPMLNQTIKNYSEIFHKADLFSFFFCIRFSTIFR